MRVCLDHDLVFRIDGGDPRVALDHPFVGRHLRAFGARATTRAQTTGRATALRRMRREPRAERLRILREPRDPGGGLGGDIGLALERIGRPMPLQHCQRRQLQQVDPLRALGPCAAPMLRRIARQFDAIKRTHLAPN